jgi:hypothetical protein
LTDDRADIVGLDSTQGAAAVAAHVVAIVTRFARIEDAVTATRTGISLHTSLRAIVGEGYIRQREAGGGVPAGVPISTNASAASASADAATTSARSSNSDSSTLGGASSKAKSKAEDYPSTAQFGKGLIQEREGKRHRLRTRSKVHLADYRTNSRRRGAWKDRCRSVRGCFLDSVDVMFLCGRQ